ncbi:unnamed protein product [Schistosoma margrebowiei]|uniref:Uncharacterized protein n=1 Tax=Schistosoma margrebowiei TaxID=48269 RepID=A0A183LFH2_9TREM|nr:unnamed protein product [Schistosoma margrebowiei]
MVVGGSQQEILNLSFVLLSTCQQSVLVLFLKEPMLPDRLDPLSPIFTIRDITTELSEPVEIMNQLKLDHYGKPGSTGRPFHPIMVRLSGSAHS